MIRVPGHLTDGTEQLAGIVKGREKEKETVKGEVSDIGAHWNVKGKESGIEKEKEIEKGIGCGKEREEECLHHQQGDLHLEEGTDIM